MEAQDDPTDDTAREAPRALSPGAILGEYEIKEVLARGLTNLYIATTGLYGPPQHWIIAEREFSPEPEPQSQPTAQAVAPVATAPQVLEAPAPPSASPTNVPQAAASTSAPVASTSQAPSSTSTSAAPESISGAGLTDVGEFSSAAESGGFASEAGVFDAPIAEMSPLELSPAPTSPSPSTSTHEPAPAPTELYLDPEPLAPVMLRPANEVQLDEVNVPDVAVVEEEDPFDDVPALLMAGEVWEQDGRQYCAWEFQETTSLHDFRDATNDERYLEVLERIAEAMAWQKSRSRVLEMNRDTLRFDAAGRLHFYGFSSPLDDPSELLNQLRGINEFLLKHTFANSGTMRLDDPFAGLPLAQETKGFAHRLSETDFATFEEAHAALQVLGGGVSEMEMSVALITDVGRERELNEDSGLIARCSRKTTLSPLEWELLVVADGMGGHEGGELASDLTVRVLHQQLLEAQWDWNDNTSIRTGLLNAIMTTNARVAALAEEPKYKGSRSRPGSTLTFALRLGRRVFVGNVGDSRTYLFRDNQLLRVTKDHSYVQNLIDAGALKEEDAWDHPDGSVITAHIGEANLKTRDVFLRLLLQEISSCWCRTAWLICCATATSHHFCRAHAPARSAARWWMLPTRQAGPTTSPPCASAATEIKCQS
jgi:protein phosphatase